jgi:hypothetical protein
MLIVSALSVNPVDQRRDNQTVRSCIEFLDRVTVRQLAIEGSRGHSLQFIPEMMRSFGVLHTQPQKWTENFGKRRKDWLFLAFVVVRSGSARPCFSNFDIR